VRHQTRIAAMVIAAFAVVVVLRAQDPLDYALLARVQDEGLSRSQVMDHVGWLSDVYGPRLTGSPGFQQAADWAVKRLGDWGLVNAKTEKWKFGKGWSLTRFQAHLLEPQVQPMIGYPKAWTPGTKGPVTAEVVRVAIGAESDFEKYRGRLAGKIVLAQPARDVRMLEGRITWRMGDEMFSLSGSNRCVVSA
jgi:carboxypeptidase Q